DTDRVLDASRITPPAQRTGRDIAITVRLDAGSAIEELASISHRLWAERTSARDAVVTLDGADRIPNKDFILRWRVAGAQKKAALLATGGKGGTFALMLTPEAREADPVLLPKEMVFVIDTSCSMSGAPIAAEKRAMRSAIEQMNPDDTFMVIDFADRASSFHATPLPNTPPNVRRALAYLEALPASGGTNQLEGINRALTLPDDPRRLRMVLFMTDGFIGNETQVLSAAERNLGAARLFSFGVGTSVNHYLLSRLAESGRGFYQYIRPDEDPEFAVERFVRRIERPLLTDIEVDWGGLQTSEVLPRKIPDLFDAQPLVLLGRYQNPGRAVVTLRGRQNGAPVETRLEVTLPENDGSAPGLPAMWARARIAELDRQQHGGERADIIRQITTIGLEHHLVTAYTSLVAVDEVRVARAGDPRTVTVPTEKPELTGEGDDRSRSKAPPKAPDLDGDGLQDGTEALGGDDPRSQHGAAPKPADGKKVGVKISSEGYYANRSTIDFSDDTIEGELTRPGGEYIDTRNRAKFKSLIKVRENFNDKIDSHPSPLADPAPKPTVPVPTASVGKAPSPEVSGSAGLVTGSIDRGSLQRVISAHLGQVRACYEKALLKQPGLSGKLVLEWAIGPDGKTRRVRVKTSTLTSAEVEACVVKTIEGWVFPRPAGGGEVVVSYPFVFASTGD
ncbi:MAG: AgmX/PglI C-terminal domain-containing protein, partial [Myxococcaceae bacterium]